MCFNCCMSITQTVCLYREKKAQQSEIKRNQIRLSYYIILVPDNKTFQMAL